ncbi:hypothetical protein FB451DRAFT_1567115 [Mycena latifolia]|nr:hypothetical protein FB451DRAFT_1567115 [Mycena latifolia]
MELILRRGIKGDAIQYWYPTAPRTMFNKVISSTLLFLVLAQAISLGPGPVKIHCGDYGDRPCASGWLCCAQDGGNYCQPGELLCRVPTK